MCRKNISSDNDSLFSETQTSSENVDSYTSLIDSVIMIESICELEMFEITSKDLLKLESILSNLSTNLEISHIECWEIILRGFSVSGKFLSVSLKKFCDSWVEFPR